MNLIIDIGNSAVKMAVMDSNNSLIEYYRHDSIQTRLISDLLGRFDIDSSIWISTRKLDRGTIDHISSITPFSINFKPGVTHSPIENCYESPDRLGADRLALAVGVNGKLPGKDCLIFDFGTALTIDSVNSKGQFLGGSISPGLQLRLSSLYEHTGALPLLNASRYSDNNINSTVFPPRNTEDAIFQGVYKSMLYEIEGYTSRNPDAEIVFSGYDAKYFVDKFKITIFAEYDILLFEGLNIILESNK